MSAKKISVFLTGLLVLSVLLTAPAQANSTDETEARSSPPQVTLMSLNDTVIGSSITNSEFVQGATVELKWRFENFENNSNLTLKWGVQDNVDRRSFAILTAEYSENFSLMNTTNYTLEWTLKIPTDSCVVNIIYSLDPYFNFSQNHWNAEYEEVEVLICDWVIALESNQSSIMYTAESMLELNAQGLELNVQERFGTWTLTYLDYESGNRDGALNQSEFDAFFEAETITDECLQGDVEIGLSWSMNGEEVQLNQSYCELTFDDTGIQFSQFYLFNGTWEADMNGEFELEVYSGRFYENCTYITNSPIDLWQCMSDDPETVFYYDQNFLDSDDWPLCVQENESTKWNCRGQNYSTGYFDVLREFDNCTLLDNYGGFEFECMSDGVYRSYVYYQPDCELLEDGMYYCYSTEEQYEENWNTEYGEWAWDAEKNRWQEVGDSDMWWYYCELIVYNETVPDNTHHECTDVFGQNPSFANTTGNTHYTDGTDPSISDIFKVRYGVIGSDDFDLVSGKFVQKDGIRLMMSVSSGAAYVDIPYNWDTIDHGTFVWKIAIDDSTDNSTDNNTDNNTGENRLPVCTVFTVAEGTEPGSLAASEVAEKIQNRTSLDAPLNGTATVPLLPGEYEFMIDCTDPDADDLVISISDGTVTITAEAMDGHFYGGIGFSIDDDSSFTHNVTVSWTDGTASGELKITFTTEPSTDTTTELPGFTGILGTIALLGAVYLRRDE